MNLEQIVGSLKKEREKLDRAITVIVQLNSDSDVGVNGGRTNLGKKWSPAQRRKFKATMAARHGR